MTVLFRGIAVVLMSALAACTAVVRMEPATAGAKSCIARCRAGDSRFRERHHDVIADCIDRCPGLVEVDGECSRAEETLQVCVAAERVSAGYTTLVVGLAVAEAIALPYLLFGGSWW